MWGAIGSVAAPILGGLLGGGAASDDEEKSQRMMENALKELQNIKLPEQRMLKLEEMKSAGLLTPEMEQAFSQEDSEFGGISLDPALRDAQMGALGKLQQIGDEGGMNLQDRARLNDVLGQFNQTNRGQQAAIQQGMARRGMGGSGAELAAAMQAQQGAAGNAAQQSLGVEAMAQQRALEGLISAGQMGGNIRGQDYAEQAKAAQAQDLINRFNVANRQDVGARNVGTRNQAQASNLQNKQNLMNQNTGQRNQALMYNLDAGQRNFNNQMTKAGPTMGAQKDMAGMYGQQAQGKRDLWSGVGQSVGQGAGAYGQHQQYQEFLDRKYPQE